MSVKSKSIITMKHSIKLTIGICAWSVIGAAGLSLLSQGCTFGNENASRTVEEVSDKGMLTNDNLVAVKEKDGLISIKNIVTGETTIKNIKIDWMQSSRDSFAVFCSENKRGYYNTNTGKIAIAPQYRRAWIFSEGLAAVQKDGNIGFIDHSGKTVIDFIFPYHGNPLSEFVFMNGYCVVADSTGQCGVINTKGDWVIPAEYDHISTFKEYAIVRTAGLRKQMSYDGKVLNSFVLDYLSELTYKTVERVENKEGNVEYMEKTVHTGYYSYCTGGRCGLMDSDCRRLTEPLYSSIRAVNNRIFRAVLIDGYSEVILNNKGEVMK